MHENSLRREVKVPHEQLKEKEKAMLIVGEDSRPNAKWNLT